MAIVAVLSSLGALGLNVFRETSMLQQANAELISNLRSAQNLARNSIISQKLLTSTGSVLLSQVAGYAIYFESSGNYSLRYCKTQVVSGVTQYDCSSIERPNLKSPTFNEVTAAPSDTAKCKAILFIRGTDDISALSSTVDAPDNTGTCTLEVTVPGTGGDFRPIVIDLAENNTQT